MSGKSPKTGTRKISRKWLVRNIVKVIIIVVAVAVIAIIMKMPPRKKDAPPAPAPPVNVTVMTVAAEAEFPDTFELPAIVEPNRVVAVSAEVEGRVERIPCKEGCAVKAGDLLIELNDDLIRPAFEVAEAQEKRNQIERDRMKNLVDDEATSQRDLDDAETQLAISKAQLQQARASLERTRIIAPIGGILNDVLVEEGEYVQVGTPVAELVETDTVKVVVEVPERDIIYFDTGRKAEVLAHTRDGHKWLTGETTFISELADSQTRSTRMEITLENKQGLIRSGQIVSIRLTRRLLKDAVLIPLLAVVPMEEGNAVYVVNSTEVERKMVVLGIIKGDRVQIKSGIKPGDRLIIAGHRFIAPGQKVNISESK
jgi:membrane fusion protein (multidrug efflux system)